MANIQTIELRDDLFENVRNCTKIATLRKGVREYALGNTLLYGKKYCDMVTVKDVIFKKFNEITDNDAKQEGYNKANELKNVMKEFYPDITEDTICTQVWFEYNYSFNY